MTEEDIEIYVNVNGQGYYVIEDTRRNKWIKLKPDFEGSGVHIVKADKKQHHYDLYDDEGNKIENRRIDIIGYSEPGQLYMQSGQTIWEIDPEKEPKVIPTVPANLVFFPSGSVHVAKADTNGWCIAIVKEED